MCMSKDSLRKSKLNEANLLMDDCRSFSSVTNRFSGCIRDLWWEIVVLFSHVETCPSKSSIGVPAVEVCVKHLIVA
jgi:hypothetical protein